MAYFTPAARAAIVAERPALAGAFDRTPRRTTTRKTAATEASTSAAPKKTATAKPNLYGGTCTICGTWVEAEQGLRHRERYGAPWTVTHNGPCPKPVPAANEVDATDVRRTNGPVNLYGGNCNECSEWIEAEAGVRIKTATGWKVAHRGQCPEVPAVPAAEATPAVPDRPAQINRYGGKCVTCQEWVEAEAGIRFKDADGWKTAHHDGQCPETDGAKGTGGERIELTDAQMAALPKGYYTVQLDGGEYRTFRIRIKPKGQRNEGKAEISYLGGPNNQSDYWLLGTVEDNAIVTTKKIHNKVLRTTLDILIGDPHAAQLGFARASKHCYMCGQPLTTPESLDRGTGPDCNEK